MCEGFGFWASGSGDSITHVAQTPSDVFRRDAPSIPLVSDLLSLSVFNTVVTLPGVHA